MSAINILFYSNKCDGSQILLSMMNDEGLTKYFHKVCIDNNPRVPPQIKVTPTLIIRGQPVLYAAGDAFTWLARVKQWKIIMTMKDMSNRQRDYFNNINGNLSMDELKVIGYNSTEMANITSFYPKDITQEDQDIFQHSFVRYDDIGKEFINTQPLECGSYNVTENQQYKINEGKQKELLNNLQKEREKQDNTFQENINNFINNIASNPNKK